MSSFTSRAEERHYFETQVSEKEFLEWYKKQHFPTQDMPSVTVDMVLFCYNKEQDDFKVLLIKRKTHPFQNSWALPGGFVRNGEATSDSCIRETKEETNVSITRDHIEQLHTFSTPNRDPRGWVITVSYLAFIGEEPLEAGDQAADATWFSIDRKGELIHLTSEEDDAKIVLNLKTGESLGTESLAFDHSQIIIKAFNRVCNKMYHEPQVLRVLGHTFTITEARKVYAKFLGVNYREIDHSNFKKAMLPYFKEIGEKPMGVGRPSKIYELHF
ncbi:NUDIX domain-containing protein [Vagococcus fluvialis]|uniref:NUDIX domain-containing protein n=1 Tax=Vagococcus fluvialis TaxID=2738 RepID=UPI001D0A4475|nr:NUDIX domain-containing protein [Vagococcus fluvialis]UDM79272.1 NUDIX hydrolase [Vagococcus fluvialis]